MSYKKITIKKITQAIALTAVVSTGVMTIVGSGSGGSGVTATDDSNLGGGNTYPVDVNFPGSLPLFFAWLNVATGNWQVLNPTQNTVTLDVTSATLANAYFTIVAVCAYRAALIGYAYQTTAQDMTSTNLRCDDTASTTTYQIGGTLGNQDSFDLAFGMDHKNNWSAKLGGSYTYDVTLDDDEPKVGDFIIRGFGYGSHHIGMVRRLNISWAPTADFTAAPADEEEPFGVDVGSLLGLPGYAGTFLKLDTFNTKVTFGENIVDGNVTFGKLPLGLREVDDIYSTRVESKVASGAGLEISKVFQLRSNPTSLSFDKFPTPLPSISLSNDSDFSLKVKYDSAYDNGMTGMSDVFRKVNASNATINWDIYQTAGRFGTGEQTIELPRAIDGLSGFSSDWLVTDTDVKKVTNYMTDGDGELLREYLQNQHDGDASVDGLNYATAGYRF